MSRLHIVSIYVHGWCHCRIEEFTDQVKMNVLPSKTGYLEFQIGTILAGVFTHLIPLSS